MIAPKGTIVMRSLNENALPSSCIRQPLICTLLTNDSGASLRLDKLAAGLVYVKAQAISANQRRAPE
jgi:hypothetical protein